MNDVFDIIEETELTPDLQIMADLCGIDLVRKLLRTLPGMSFYIPKITRLDGFVRRFITLNHDKSRKQIAKALNVSENYLKQFMN
jgi:hypothetical protein